MGARITFNEEQIKEIIRLYNIERLGTPSIGKIFNVGKQVINRILKENNIALGISGRRYKGGKTESDKRYYKKNKNKISEYHKKWSKTKRPALREYHKTWRDKNRDKLRKHARNYEKKKTDNNPIYKLNKRIRTALYICVKERNIHKYGTTFQILGYGLNELMTHIEKQFTEGMNWENYGEWHIDHIIPLSQFKFDSINDYEFKKCWSLDNLRPMWATNRVINNIFYEGNLNKGAKKNTICYQYRMRENKKLEEKSKISFNINELNLKDAEIRLINRVDAKKIIEEYEWLSYMPSFTKYHFGIFFKIKNEEYLGGTLCFQPEYSENTGVWDKYDYTNKILLLSRGVCLWWTPKNTATYFISKALKWIEKNTNYRVITATVDELAGEIGTIYQASNWHYVGVMNGNILKNGKERERLGVIMNNKLYTSRKIKNMLGTIKKSVILKHYPDAKFIKQKAKKRYFYFLGTKREKSHNLSKIKSQIKSYPKR